MVALKDTRVNNDFHNTGALYVGHNIGDTVANGDKVYVDNYEGAAGRQSAFWASWAMIIPRSIIWSIENDSTGESLCMSEILRHGRADQPGHQADRGQRQF